jgi:general secretion pathway protein D
MGSRPSIGWKGREVYARARLAARHSFVRALTLVVLLAAGWPAGGSLAAADDAAKLYEEGRKAERSSQMVRAYLLYSQAAALEPSNQFYWLKSQAVQSRAALESPPKAAGIAGTGGGAVGAASAFDSLSPKDRAAERDAQPPPELKGDTGRKDFDLRADARSLWEQVTRAFGLDTVFDGDYPTAGPPLRFRLADAGYRDALHALEAATGSFVAPISSRLLLVVQDTEQKRREVEPTAFAAIPIPQATSTQELVEVTQAVRQIFNLEHVAWDTQQNVVVLRDRVSRVAPARQVFEELLHHRPQVDIEVDLIEVDRSQSLAYGVDLPTTFPLIYMGTFWHTPLSIPSTISKLMTFGGGQTMFGIAVADATLIANMTRSNSNNLLRADVHALDGLPATLHVGDRFPVLTSGYFGPASFSQGGQVYMPPPSFSFEDLGVSVKVTPRVHGMDEVTLDLETEFKVLSGQSVNGIPVISSRKVTSKVRLRDGEWGVVAGLLNSSEARTIHGVAGLASLPALGQLFRKTNKDESTTQILLVIKPTLLNLPPDQFVTPTIFTGSETRPVTPL